MNTRKEGFLNKVSNGKNNGGVSNGKVNNGGVSNGKVSEDKIKVVERRKDILDNGIRNSKGKGNIVKNNRINNNNGMITVEVSFIVPVLAFLILGSMFFLLFFLDMSAAKSEAILIANEAAFAWKNDGDMTTGEYEKERLLSRSTTFLLTDSHTNLSDRAKKRLQERIDRKLIITKANVTNVKISAGQVVVNTKIVFPMPIKLIEKYMGMESLFFSCSSKAPVDNWEEWLRAAKGIKVT